MSTVIRGGGEVKREEGKNIYVWVEHLIVIE